MARGKQTEADRVITIPRIDIVTLPVTVEGTSRLVSHRWTAKAIKAMRDKQGGVPAMPLEPKDPEKEWIETIYEHRDDPKKPGWYGMPAHTFKFAMVDACRVIKHKDLTMILTRQIIYIDYDGVDYRDGKELVQIFGDGPHMREDPVPISTTYDLRYRGEWPTWHANLRIRFPRNVISEETVLHLLSIAGQFCGIGEGRMTTKKSPLGWGCWQIKQQAQAAMAAE